MLRLLLLETHVIFESRVMLIDGMLTLSVELDVSHTVLRLQHDLQVLLCTTVARTKEDIILCHRTLQPLEGGPACLHTMLCALYLGPIGGSPHYVAYLA
jgi:hypothetical protein